MQTPVFGGGTPVVTSAVALGGAPAPAFENEPDDSRTSVSDAVAALLEQRPDERKFRFSLAADSAGRVQARQIEGAVPLNPEPIATQWSALHAYMDQLATTTNMDGCYGAQPARLFNQPGVLASTGGAFAQAGMAGAPRIEIRDSSVASFRSMSGLSEGFALLG